MNLSVHHSLFFLGFCNLSENPAFIVRKKTDCKRGSKRILKPLPNLYCDSFGRIISQFCEDFGRRFGAIIFYSLLSSLTYYNFRMLVTANSGHYFFSFPCGFGENLTNNKLAPPLRNPGSPTARFGTLPLLGRPQTTFFETTSVTARVTDAASLVVIAVESFSSRNRCRSARHLQHVKHFERSVCFLKISRKSLR